jgi:hypothetical protein
MVMLSFSRFSSSAGSDWLGEALLNWGFLRAGVRRWASIEELPDDLRRDVGLLPREKTSVDLRDLRW